jgi:hypothetical protein
MFFLNKRNGKRTSSLQRFLFTFSLICTFTLLGTFIRGYFFFDQGKYGRRFNKERARMGVDTIPQHFQLVEGPIADWKDYFEKHHIYRLVYQSNNTASGHFRKEADIGENGPGRELDFYLKGKDTVITTFNYLDKTKITQIVSAPNTFHEIQADQ